MDEPKKMKSPILEIWRRLMKGNTKTAKSETKEKEKEQQNPKG